MTQQGAVGRRARMSSRRAGRFPEPLAARINLAFREPAL